MSKAAGVLLAVALAAGVALDAQSTPWPDWAYGYLRPHAPGDTVAPPCPPGAKGFPDCAYVGAPVPEDGVKRSLPGAAAQFTRNEAYFDYGPADWYPNGHPPMPDIVAKGKQSAGSRACALCHYPNGQGKMENGGVAGLPSAYILSQLNAFKTGARRSAENTPRRVDQDRRRSRRSPERDVRAHTTPRVSVGASAQMPVSWTTECRLHQPQADSVDTRTGPAGAASS